MKTTILLTLGLLSMQIQAMDLLDTYQLALSNDPAWRATLNTYLADQQNERIAYGSLLTSAALSVSGSRNRYDPASSSQNFYYNASRVSLSARQPLFRPEAWQRYQQAKVSTNLNEAKLQSQQQDFILKVTEAYLNVLRAEATVDALKAEERALERQNTMMTERFKAGLIAKTDVTEALAQYQNAQANRISGEIAVTSAQEALSAIVGQPITALASLREDMAYQAPYPADMNAWVTLAKTRHPQIDVARFQYEVAEKNRKVQLAGHQPTLDFVGNASVSRQDLSLGTSTNDANTYSLGLELNIPLYMGGQVTASVRQASYQVDAAREQMLAAERQVVAQARTAFLNIQADRAKIEARQEAVNSGETVAKASQVGYELGVRNIVDVLLAQRNAFATKRDYVTARYDYVLNVVRLRAAAGQLTANDLAEINTWLSPSSSIQPIHSNENLPKTGTALDR
jgi:outer membrane protein